MKSYPCKVCDEPIELGMCQSGIVIEGDKFPAHVACADKWASEDIDVWHIKIPGGPGYYECFPENVTEMLKEMDEDSEYQIKKVRMNKAKYHTLPEFTGF